MQSVRRVGLVIALLLAGLACEPAEPPRAPSMPPWPEGDLVAVALPAPDRAIVAAVRGAIHFGNPAAGAFERAHVPAIDGLAAIAMADARAGWAIGPGTVLRTEDGGARWVRQRLPGVAREHGLVSVAAIDALRAVAVDDRGRVISTQDGGVVWQSWPDPGERAATAEAGASSPSVACSAPRAGGAVCVAVGVAGVPGLARLDVVDRTIRPVSFAPPASTVSVGFHAGGAEPDPAGVEALDATARRLAAEPIVWSIDVHVSAAEVERATTEQDPGVLFDLIEARTEEVASRLEGAGVGANRIVPRTSPPWGFEDQLDDDPGLLTRYWQSRLAPRPAARAESEWRVALDRVAIDATGTELLATGGEGMAFWRRGDVPPSRTDAVARSGPGPLALAKAGPGWVAVGHQGGVWSGEPDRDGLRWQAKPLRDAFFTPLRAVAVAEAGGAAMAVGDAGRMLWSDDGGFSWRTLAPPDPAGARVGH